MALFVAFGLAYSYGQFFVAMAADFGAPSTAGGTVFSVTSLVFFCLGVGSGPLADRVGPRLLLGAATVLIASGLIATSYTQELWQAYLAYGIGIGLGVGCVYVPIVTATGRWFERRRSLATGFVVSGIGLGTVIVPPVSAWLVESYGWPTAYRCYAVAICAVLLLATALMANPPPSREPGSRNAADRRRRRRRFLLFYTSALLTNIGLYVPFVYLSPAARDLGVEAVTAAALVSTIGLASVFGRIALGALADRVSTLVLYRACSIVIALSFWIWGAASNYAVLLVFSIVLGLGYGGYIALTSVVLSQQFGLTDLGRLLGLTYTAVGIGSAAGPALLGALLSTTGSYTPGLLLLALLALAGAVAISLFRDRAT
ncbi:OFA family MFS transporter [Salinactinospora qingdaonensis]|uniref:OFA family MFS transporter n=2 Tax=Salinactinospora qingdaonensis TaxID=702744 RepID=A0ABP7FK35_9ACTN